MKSDSSVTIAKMRALRQAKKLRCSGAHQTEDGVWHPCASADELSQLSSTPLIQDNSKIRSRSTRGVNKIRRQWETPQRREYVAVDNISNTDLANSISFKGDWYAPSDNDVDVFLDMSSAQKRSRQLGCIGVSRRISKSGKTVWMPCTNMSDYARVAGTTSLGRRHLREQAKRTILETVERAQKPLKTRKKSLFSEINIDVNGLSIKALGPNVGTMRRPAGPTAVDITGTIDADMDGIVFEGTPKVRPLIPGVNAPDLSNINQDYSDTLPETSVSQELQSGERKPRKSERAARLVAEMKDKKLNKLTPTNDIYRNANLSKIINESVPTTEKDLLESLKSNPYSRKNWQKTFDAITKATPDWEETTKIKNMLQGMVGESGDNSGLQKLIRIHGMPTIVATKNMPRHKLFQRKFWEFSTGAYHSDGYIAFNADAFGRKGSSWWTGSDAIPDSELAHDLRHELAHAFQFMAIAQNQQAKDNFTKSFIDDFLPTIEEPENKLNRRRTKHSLNLSWGNDDEIADAYRISDYASMARIEYFAESLAMALSGDRRDMAKVSGQTISHMADSLGVTMPEILDILGRNNENDFNDLNISQFLNDGTNTRLRSQRINKIDKPLVEFAEKNPELIDEIPMRIRKNMSPEAMKLARDSRIDGRRAYATERTANGTIIGAGGMAITRKIIGNVDENSRNKSDKKFFMVAGTSGSGKSTLVESGLIPNMPTEQKAAHLDIDKFKKGLYGYNNGEGAVQVHPAARTAVRKAVDASAARGIDVVLQGYGNDSAQLRRAKSMGYQTIGHFVYTSKSVASKRVEDREEVGGPKIGSELSQILSDELPSRIAQQIQRGLYDDFYLWDNNKNSKDGAFIKPEVIASRSADGSYSIENEPLFNKFFGADSKDIKKYWETNKDLNTAINDTPQSIDSYSSNDGKVNYKKFNGFKIINPIKNEDIKDENLSRYIFDNQVFAEGANLSSKNASYSSYSFAKMSKSKFGGSKLFGSKFKNTDLRDADFNSLNDKQLTDLRYADFSNAVLTNANMRGANLQGVHFSHADLRNVDFRSANLLSANLDGANLSGANLNNAKILKSQLTNSRWNGSTIFPDGFVPPEMTPLRLDEPSPRRLPGIFDSGPDDAAEIRPYVKGGFVSMNGVDNNGISIPGRDLGYATIMSSTFDKGNLDNSILFDSDIVNSSMSGALLRNVDLRYSNIDNVNFSYSKMNGSNLDGANIINETSFVGAKLRNSRLTNMTIAENSDFRGADLRNANLSNTDLSMIRTDKLTNLDGAIFSFSKHYPKAFKGKPTVSIPFADSSDTRNSDILDMNSPLFQGVDGAKLLMFAEKNLYDKSNKSTYRGLSIDDWVQHLDNVDSHIIDNNDSIAHLVNRNEAVSRDIDSLKNFKLPDGSSIDVISYTSYNSPNKFIQDIEERKSKNPDAFKNSNPKLLWERAMSVREQEKRLKQQNDELEERRKELNRLANLSKTIDALYVNGIHQRDDKPIERPAANLIRLETPIYQAETLIKFSPRAARKIRRAVNKLVDDDFVVSSRSKRDTKKSFAPKKTSKEKLDSMYQAMTDALIASLEDAKDGNWERPWKLNGMPRNAITGKPYAGGNSVVLALVENGKGYEMPVWMTFKQAKALGGTVRAGEKGTECVYWARRESTKVGPDGTEDRSSFLVANFFHVFNIAQTDGIDPERFKIEELSPEQRLEALDKIVSELSPLLVEGTGDKNRAYYSPSTDGINMPPFGYFENPLSYYQTLMHELVHWTGHTSRMDRANMNQHGTPEYAYEELVAEIGSVFLMGILGLEPEPQENHSIYIAGWLTKLKNDPDMVRKASAEAQKAVNFLLNKSPTLQAEYDRGFPDVDETIDAGEKVIDDSLQVVEDAIEDVVSDASSSRSKRLPSPGEAPLESIAAIMKTGDNWLVDLSNSNSLSAFGYPIVGQSKNHPHVPVVRFPRIPILDKSTGLSDEDFELIDSVEYLTKERKDALRDFGEQERLRRSKLTTGWNVNPQSLNDRGLSFMRLEKKLELVNSDGETLFTSKKIKLQKKNLFNNQEVDYIFIPRTFFSLYDGDDLSQAIFVLNAELSKFDISNITINDLFDFPDTENGQWIREQLNKFIEYRKNSDRFLEQINSGFKRLSEEVKKTSSSIEEIDTFEIEDIDVLDGVFSHIKDRIQAIKTGKIGDIDQIGGVEHEFGHIALGLGFDRHGDYASQYAAHLMHGGQPYIGIVVNAINSIQAGGFARDQDGNNDGTFVIPLWSDVPESMWGWPDGSSSRSTKGSRGAPSFAKNLKNEEDIPDTGVAQLTKDGYLDVPRPIEIGNKAELPNGETMVLDSLDTSTDFVSKGGSLSQVPDTHLQQAIEDNASENPQDGKRFNVLGFGEGVHGMLRLEDTTNGGMIGFKYSDGFYGYGELLEDGPRNEVISEIVAEIFGFPAMPMRLIRREARDFAPGEPAFSLITNLAHNAYIGQITPGGARYADRRSSFFNSISSGVQVASLEQRLRMLLLDSVIANQDRHRMNMLVSTDDNGNSSLIPIDHSWGLERRLPGHPSKKGVNFLEEVFLYERVTSSRRDFPYNDVFLTIDSEEKYSEFIKIIEEIQKEVSSADIQDATNRMKKVDEIVNTTENVDFSDNLAWSLSDLRDRLDRFSGADAEKIAGHILPKEIIGHNAAINKALSLDRMLTQEELIEIAEKYKSDARLLKLAVLAFLESIEMIEPPKNYSVRPFVDRHRSSYQDAMEFYLRDKDAYEAFIKKIPPDQRLDS